MRCSENIRPPSRGTRRLRSPPPHTRCGQGEAGRSASAAPRARREVPARDAPSPLGADAFARELLERPLADRLELLWLDLLLPRGGEILAPFDLLGLEPAALPAHYAPKGVLCRSEAEHGVLRERGSVAGFRWRDR